jgi:hypothetical protein
MTLTKAEDPRVARLLKFFNDVLHDRRSLTSSRDGGLFIESVCAQADAAVCLHKLVSSPSGLTAIKVCVRFDTSPQFINDNTFKLLQYLQAPCVESIDSGAALGKVLVSMINPPFFWDSFTKAYQLQNLTPASCQAFAWLLLRLIYLPGTDVTSYLALAKSPDILDSLLKSPEGETRLLAQKIKHALSLESPNLHFDAEVKPGGRHDNDHADHRHISIMPTADELLSVSDVLYFKVPNIKSHDP